MNQHDAVQLIEGRHHSDALSFEYKRDYGCATRQLKLSDLVNYPPLAGELCRLGLGFSEESLNLVLSNRSALSDDGSDSQLVASETVQHLP